MSSKHLMLPIVFLLGLLMPSCASVPMAPESLQTVVRQFAPPANKSRIYIVRPGQTRTGLARISVNLDRQFIGNIINDTFMVLDVQPGEHELNVHHGPGVGAPDRPGTMNLEWNRNPSTVRMNLLPGKCYFFSTYFIIAAPVQLSVISDEEGRKYVNEFKMVESSRVVKD
jgi:hypothetical protein